MTNQLATSNKNASITETIQFVTPLLDRIQKESKQEFVEMQQAFELMGWAGLPEELKIEIYNDVKFMVQELKGYYSSCDPFVRRRQETVHYWVSSYKDGICSLNAAIKALKIRQLA
ncbi:MAG: hypothetical protein WC967_08110 [Balneolaceae bacterium]